MTIEGIPRVPVHDRPDGFEEHAVQVGVLRDTITGAGVELGAYERQIIDWLAHWEWATIVVIASWVARAAEAREPAPTVALPSRFDATPAEVDQHLRRILAEDTYLSFQQAIGAQAMAGEAERGKDTSDGESTPGPAEPLIVSRYDVVMEPAPEEDHVLTVGALAEDGRPVALLFDQEARRRVAGWLAPDLTDGGS